VSSSDCKVAACSLWYGVRGSCWLSAFGAKARAPERWCMMAGYVVDAGISLSQIGSPVVKCVSEKGKGASTTSLAEQVWYDFQSQLRSVSSAVR
jgi:hypothetical protein